MKIIQPYKTYNGGKSGNGTYQNIINHIPKCRIFIDAMVGNGGIVSNLNLPSITIINDIDLSIINDYKINLSKGIIDNNIYTGVSADIDQNIFVGQKQEIILENLDFPELIDKYDYSDISGIKDISLYASDIFFYFDPPYLKSTRRNQKDLYKFDWDKNQHIKFINRSLTVKSNCMISHYPCKLYDEAFNSWNKFDFVSTTRNGQRIERIYMNYSKPLLLQDFRYLGKDFTDRQRLKRKAERLNKKLNNLPDEEKIYLFSSLLKTIDNSEIALSILNKT